MLFKFGGENVTLLCYSMHSKDVENKTNSEPSPSLKPQRAGMLGKYDKIIKQDKIQKFTKNMQNAADIFAKSLLV